MAHHGSIPTSQPSLFPQVSGVQPQSQSATYSNSSGEGSRAGIQLPDVCRRRHGGNAQSEAANAKVAPAKKGMRVAILTALAASDSGKTSKEIALLFGKHLHQISGRLSELRADGLIVESGIVRDGAAVLVVKRG